MIVSDGQGAAWVGSDSGNVRRVELKHKEVTAGKTRLWLESVFTLKHHPKSRRTSTQLGSATSLDLDDLSRADSARASEDFTSAEEPATAPGTKAHAGPVTAIEMHRNTVYTSGGSTGTAALHEWTQGGALHHAHKLRELGTTCLFWSTLHESGKKNCILLTFRCCQDLGGRGFAPCRHLPSIWSLLGTALYVSTTLCTEHVQSFHETSMRSNFTRQAAAFVAQGKQVQSLHRASRCMHFLKQAWVLVKTLQHLISTSARKASALSFLAGVARAVRMMGAVVTVRPPEDFIRQASSDEAVSAVDTSSPSSASPGTGNWDAASGHKRNSTQLVTAHDNGQLQVWDMSTGFLQPVLRIGVAGPSARSALPAHNSILKLILTLAQITRKRLPSLHITLSSNSFQPLCKSLEQCSNSNERQAAHVLLVCKMAARPVLPNRIWSSWCGLQHHGCLVLRSFAELARTALAACTGG